MLIYTDLEACTQLSANELYPGEDRDKEKRTAYDMMKISFNLSQRILDYAILVAVTMHHSGDGQKIIGVVELDTRPKIDSTGERNAYITNLVVDPAFRNQGLGTELLKLCEWCTVVHHSDSVNICLKVEKDNLAAQRLYYKKGYRIAGTANDYHVPMSVMCKRNEPEILATHWEA